MTRAVLALTLALSGCSAPSASTAPGSILPGATPSPTAVPSAAADEPMSWSGVTSTDTGPFHLRGGNYVATIRADGSSCDVSGAIFPVGVSVAAILLPSLSLMTVDATKSARTTADGIAPGDYHLAIDSGTGCHWRVTLTPSP